MCWLCPFVLSSVRLSASNLLQSVFEIVKISRSGRSIYHWKSLNGFWILISSNSNYQYQGALELKQYHLRIRVFVSSVRSFLTFVSCMAYPWIRSKRYSHWVSGLNIPKCKEEKNRKMFLKIILSYNWCHNSLRTSRICFEGFIESDFFR